MPDLIHWMTFFTASIVLLLIPGPSVLYVVTRGVEHGYRGVVFSAIGLALGDLAQVLCTVMGLSALLASSPLVFSIVKYAGSTYLIALGLHRLIAKGLKSSSIPATKHSDKVRPQSLVVQAFFAINPKTGIFFLALFPQFITENAGPPWLQILLLGGAFVLLGFMTNSMYGFVGGSLSRLGKQSQCFHEATRYISSIVLIAMGIGAALASTPHKPA